MGNVENRDVVGMSKQQFWSLEWIPWEMRLCCMLKSSRKTGSQPPILYGLPLLTNNTVSWQRFTSFRACRMGSEDREPPAADGMKSSMNLFSELWMPLNRFHRALSGL
jgi:hypothetical protein